jgi:hypothetical protein
MTCGLGSGSSRRANILTTSSAADFNEPASSVRVYTATNRPAAASQNQCPAAIIVLVEVTGNFICNTVMATIEES